MTLLSVPYNRNDNNNNKYVLISLLPWQPIKILVKISEKKKKKM